MAIRGNSAEKEKRKLDRRTTERWRESWTGKRISDDLNGSILDQAMISNVNIRSPRILGTEIITDEE